MEANALSKSTFLNLPDELILHTFDYLKPVRRFQVGSLDKDCLGYLRDEGKDEAKENEQRMQTLHSLCFTCKEIYQISSPMLYSAVTLPGMGTAGFRRVTLLLQTITDRPALAQHLHYIRFEANADEKSYLKYISNDRKALKHQGDPLAAFPAIRAHASRIWTGQYLEAWNAHFNEVPEQALLALLIALAPNVSHLTLTICTPSHESRMNYEGSKFFTLIGIPMRKDRPNALSTTLCTLQKLQTLCLATSEPMSIGEEARIHTYSDLVTSLQHLPALRHLQNHTPCNAPSEIISASLPNLQTLQLDSCAISLAQITATIEGCHGLRKISCSWGHYDWVDLEDVDWIRFRASLHKHKDTLECLTLLSGHNARRRSEQIATFTDLTSLRHLQISAPWLVSSPMDDQRRWLRKRWADQRPKLRISECLPPSIRSLAISGDYVEFDDESLVLWDLAQDLESGALPLLKSLRFIADTAFYSETTRPKLERWNLGARFPELGVNFGPIDRIAEEYEWCAPLCC